MEIIRKSLREGAAEAKGLAVIIDVFRAFSCQPLFYYFGASRVILETDPEKAREMKQQHTDYILVGEVNEVPMEGADMGNSPTEIIKKGKEFFEGKTVIHRTTAGVTGAVAAFQQADEVVLGSFVTAGAISRYIRERDPRILTLVGMGDRANKPAPEDEACADYIEHLLTGKPYDPVQALQQIVFQVTAQKFIVGGKEYLPREDPIFCLQRDLFDFVLTVGREGDLLQVFQVLPPSPEEETGELPEKAKQEVSASPEKEEEEERGEPLEEGETQEEDRAGAGDEGAGEESRDEETEEEVKKEPEETEPSQGGEPQEGAAPSKTSKKKKKQKKKKKESV